MEGGAGYQIACGEIAGATFIMCRPLAQRLLLAKLSGCLSSSGWLRLGHHAAVCEARLPLMEMKSSETKVLKVLLHGRVYVSGRVNKWRVQ